MTTPTGDLVGRVLGGRYRLFAHVGTGASARVYLADDVKLRRRVAVKVLHEALADDQAFLRRFRVEAQSAASLTHPNIVVVHDWNDGANALAEPPYLVTQYLEGGSLRGVLDLGHRLSPSQALLVGLDAARGLEFAHGKGYVHRDVKPANLLFGDDGRVRIGDFGLARALAEAAWTEPTGAVLGTARYAAPEQARGSTVDGRADVYSLALVLIEAITGTVPFSADTTIATLMARLDGPLVPPESIGEPMCEALSGAGALQREDRTDAAGLVRALEVAARRLPRPAPLPLAGSAVIDPTRAAAMADPTEIGAAVDTADRRVDLTHAGRATAMADVAAAISYGTAIAPEGPASTVGTDTSVSNTSVPDSSVSDSPVSGTSVSGTSVSGRPAASPGETGLVPTGSHVRAGPEPSAAAAIHDRTTVFESAPSSADVPVETVDTVDTVDTSSPRRPRRKARRADSTGAAAPSPVSTMPKASTASTASKASSVSTVSTVSRDEASTHGRRERRKGRRERTDQSPRRPRRRVIGVLLAVAVIAGGVGTAWTWWNDRPAYHDLPSVAGQPLDQARAALGQLEFRVRPISTYDENVRLDVVIAQDPRPPLRVKEGEEVTLTVSKGPKPRTVPDLAGLDVAAATEALEAERLVATTVERYDEKARVGTILDWSPRETEVPRDSPVEIYVSKGPEPREIPNVSGLTPEAASKRLRDEGFVPTVVTRPSENVPEGQVISSNYRNGTRRLPGTPVRVIVSSGPPLVTVPDVRTRTPVEAEAALRSAGFRVRQTIGSASAPVVRTDPPTGAQVRSGSSVTLHTQ